MFWGSFWKILDLLLKCLELFWNTKITSKGLLSVCRFCNENLKVLMMAGMQMLGVERGQPFRFADVTRRLGFESYATKKRAFRVMAEAGQLLFEGRIVRRA